MTVTSEPKRKNRTPEQIVADLEAQIQKVKDRAATKEAKAKPESKALIAAVRAVDKAHEAAQAEQNEALVKELETIQASLGASLIGQGLRIPKRRRKGKAA